MEWMVTRTNSLWENSVIIRFRLIEGLPPPSTPEEGNLVPPLTIPAPPHGGHEVTMLPGPLNPPHGVTHMEGESILTTHDESDGSNIPTKSTLSNDFGTMD